MNYQLWWGHGDLLSSADISSRPCLRLYRRLSTWEFLVRPANRPTRVAVAERTYDLLRIQNRRGGVWSIDNC